MQVAEVIGARGSIEAFAGYLSTKVTDADPVSNFMDFYAKHYMLSRSQWSQDMFAMYATGMKSGGRYLEIGGADGITHSNTIALRDSLGWGGILVEPDPEMFRQLKENRGHTDKVVEAAISPGGGSGRATLRRAGVLSALQGHEGKDLHFEKRINSTAMAEVITIDLTDLILQEPHLDYFSLDVEGAEMSILRSIRWEEIDPPTLITVEHNDRSEDMIGLRIFLKEKGYLELFPNAKWLTRGDFWMVQQSRSQA
jgi:FkbM family methyltransferase